MVQVRETEADRDPSAFTTGTGVKPNVDQQAWSSATCAEMGCPPRHMFVTSRNTLYMHDPAPLSVMMGPMSSYTPNRKLRLSQAARAQQGYRLQSSDTDTHKHTDTQGTT
uniref:Uncharacterized protein n=1 Tax=Eutreptiella gymnastica TaxID=73025 RepID=A0A7S4LFN8_9EUGL|mmetsp:Transcript_105523/g.178304  ORF Transcript_105523/g.178304 Transcript_105523/m.178304 type:complete len:110 (-) Transcript_105523:431-760(-)